MPAHDPGAAVLLHGRHFVLATLPDMTWSSGQPKIRGLSDGFTVDYALARDVVPADVQSQADARFTVFASDGGTCQADAGPLAIHGRMEGVFLFDEAAPTRAELHETATSMEPDAHVVQAALRGARGCTGVWARRADLPAPIVFGRRKVDADERAEVLGLLDAQPAVAALRSERAEYYADMPPEDAAAAEPAGPPSSTRPSSSPRGTRSAALAATSPPRSAARTRAAAASASARPSCSSATATLWSRSRAPASSTRSPSWTSTATASSRPSRSAATPSSPPRAQPARRHYAFPDLGCGC
jgi:hypothetical protein